MKKIINSILIITIILGLTSCSKYANIYAITASSDSNYPRFHKIGSLNTSNNYIKSKGVLGVKIGDGEDDVFMFPFYTSDKNKILYSVDKDFTNAPSNNIIASQYNLNNLNKIYYALCSGYLAEREDGAYKDDYIYYANNLFHKIISNFGDDHVDLSFEDYIYASQVALHLYLNHISRDDLVKVDKYTIDDEVVLTHNTISDKEADILYEELLFIIDDTVTKLNEFEETNDYALYPQQIGDGFNITLPLNFTENYIIVPITGNISFKDSACFKLWDWMNENKQIPEELSLNINSNNVIYYPYESQIYTIKICDKDGNPCNDKGVYENGYLTFNADYAKITLDSDDFDAYNAWANEHKDDAIILKSGALGLRYLNVFDSLINYNRIFTETNTSVLKMVLPKYNPVEVKLFNITFK